MADIFLRIVNRSLSATWLVLAVVSLRFLLRKAPKWVNVLLWGMVALRLICPFTLESTLSLIPSAEVIPQEIMMDATPEIQTGIASVNRVVNPIITEAFAPEPIASANPLQILIPIFSWIWCLGMGLMMLYAAITYWQLHRKLRMAIQVKRNVFLSEDIPTPFVLGIFRPRIYLPYHMSEDDRRHVLAHERAHIYRRDHWWKPLGFLLLSVHWFNPAMWLAYILLCRDIELACDERVVQKLPPNLRADYSQALLNCSIGRHAIAVCPLAFGEVGIRERVRNVLHYKRPAFWVTVLCLVVCILFGVCFLTDPNQPAYLDVLHQNGYRIEDQEPIDVSIFISKQDLPKDIFTTEGVTFEENDYVLYDVDNTSIFLSHASLNGDQLSLILDFSYDLPGSGTLLTMQQVVYEHGNEIGISSWLDIEDHSFHDNINRFPNSIFYDGNHDDRCHLRLVLDSWNSAQDYIRFTITGFNRITYHRLSPLTSPVSTLPFVGELVALSQGETVDLRTDETLQRNLITAELEELAYRLRDIQNISPYDSDSGNDIIPLYYLDTFINGWDSVSIRGCAWENDLVLIQYRNRTYQVKDAEFSDYLDRVCSGGYTISAQEQSDWGVSIAPERVTRTGATAAFVYGGSVPGQDGAELYYGDFLSLERLDESGNWAAVAELPGYEYYVGDSSYPVVDGYGMVHEWQDRFGVLPNGNYRIGKSVTLVRQDGSQENQIIYGEFSLPDAIATEPIALDDLPERYSAEQAMLDGCIVQENGVVRENKERFQEFVANSWNGIPSYVRIFNYHHGEHYEWSVVNLRFDGSVYTITGESGTYTYRYLKQYTGEKAWENAEHDGYEYFILVNEESASWEDIQNGNLPNSHDLPAHWTVYTDFTYLPKKPQLPTDPMEAILEFEGEPLVTITDFDRLEKIWLLFENAEFLGYEPKTHSIGLGLNLILTSQSGETMTIELDPDNDICRINGEFVFYGAFDEPNYIEKLWYYLALSQWPEAVYQRYPNAWKP